MSRSLNQVYVILKGLLETAEHKGEAATRSINIPYFELKKDITKEDFEFSDLDLKITISLEWVQSDLFQHLKDYNEDSDE